MTSDQRPATKFLADERGFKAQINAEDYSLSQTNLRKSAFYQRKSARKIKKKIRRILPQRHIGFTQVFAGPDQHHHFLTTF